MEAKVQLSENKKLSPVKDSKSPYRREAKLQQRCAKHSSPPTTHEML